MKKNLYPFFLLLIPFIFSAPEADAQMAKSLLWKISGNGLDEPSFLYGTMHVGDKRAHKFKKSTLSAFESSKAYAMELDPSAVNPLELLEMMKMKDGKKLKDLFTEEEWTELDLHFKEKYRTSIEAFNDFTPFYVQSMMLQSNFKNQAGQAVDLYFYNEAKEQGKELIGLETMEEQLSAINSMPAEEQKEMLLQGMEEDLDDATDMLLKYYRKGDLEKLAELSDEEGEGTSETFEQELILKRNYRMAERLEPYIRKHSTFIGVGALHLPGEEGIIELLRKAGYTVEAVK